MKKRLVQGLFSSVSDAELATEIFQYELSEKEKSSQEQKPDLGEDNNWLPS